jgi:hypothetical protein
MEAEEAGVRPIYRIVNGPITITFDDSLPYRKISWILKDIGDNLERIGA